MDSSNYNKKELENVSKKTGIDIKKMKNAAENGNLDDFINQNLSKEASKKLQSVLNDKEATEKLLSTPQAKELLKKFLKG